MVANRFAEVYKLWVCFARGRNYYCCKIFISIQLGWTTCVFLSFVSFVHIFKMFFLGFFWSLYFNFVNKLKFIEKNTGNCQRYGTRLSACKIWVMPLIYDPCINYKSSTEWAKRPSYAEIGYLVDFNKHFQIAVINSSSGKTTIYVTNDHFLQIAKYRHFTENWYIKPKLPNKYTF